MIENGTMPVKMTEIMDLSTYHEQRPNIRSQIIKVKDARRVLVPPAMNIMFENRLTVFYQVQEMLRIEDITSPEGIALELEVYNALLPSKGNLSASMFLEYETPEERSVMLTKLLGLEQHVNLLIGELPPVKAIFDTAQIGVERISSVHYIRFNLSEEHRQNWAKASLEQQISIKVDHPSYYAEAVVPQAVANNLLVDLQN